MAMTVQLNTRIDADLKREGDAVFRRAGLTPSEVVRGTWAYAATHQEVPPFLASGQEDGGGEAWERLIEEGKDLALKLLTGEAGMPGTGSVAPSLDGGPAPYAGLEDEMYEGMVDDYERILQGQTPAH